MGKLFENVKMDIQAERRNTAKAQEELARSEQEQAIYKQICRLTRQQCSDEEIVGSLMRQFSLTREQVLEKLSAIFEES